MADDMKDVKQLHWRECLVSSGLLLALGIVAGCSGRGGDKPGQETPKAHYSAPEILSAKFSKDVLPLPNNGELFNLTLVVTFEDEDLDANKVSAVYTRPDGTSKTSEVKLTQAERYGAFVRTLDVTAADPAGHYDVQLWISDAQNLKSDVASLSYEISASAPRTLSVSSITPTQGFPGDTVTISGIGFDSVPENNRVTFAGAIGPADIVSGSDSELKAVVPEGSVTGRIAVSNTSGQVASSEEFSIATTITLTPHTTQVITDGETAFHCAVSGLVDGHIAWSVNGNDTPPESLGSITVDGIYTAPEAVPIPASVKIRCRAVADGSLYSEADVLIIRPPDSPGHATIAATSGGIASSANDTITLRIPADALAADTNISVSQLAPTDYPVAIEGSYNVAAARFEPSGLVFTKPVLATFQLSNWLEPGSVLPLFIVNETSGKLENSGATATADDSGMTATGAISHFSTLVAAVQRAAAQPTLAEQTGAFVSQSAFFNFYRIVLPAGIDWLEGLKVPILVNKIVGEQTGAGPFTAGIQVSAEFTDPTLKSQHPISVGPYVQPSGDGWQLVTAVNLPVVDTCNTGQTANARLLIGYPQQGVTQTLAIGFIVKCLNELVVPQLQTVTVSNRDSVNYYSKLLVDLGGVLRIDVHTINPAPVRIWVTSDIDIRGQIALNGTSGGDGGGSFDGDWGGTWGTRGHHYAGDGGSGGPHHESGTCIIGGAPIGCVWTSGDGVAGKNSASGAAGGAGGKVWEEGSAIDIIANFAVGLYSLADGSFVGAIQGLVNAANEYAKIVKNDENRYKSAGYGGERGHALISDSPEDLSVFIAPQAGGGGGGGGQMITGIFESNQAGAGGGGGGGGAAALELVSGESVLLRKTCILAGACAQGHIDATGGNAGNGGSHVYHETGPGGGGGGGSGGQVVVVTNRLISEGEMNFKGGRGGVPGWVDIADEYYYFINSGFGRHGMDGKIRLNGTFEGNAPINAMSFHIGPRLGPLLAIVAVDGDQWCKSVDLGGMYGFPQGLIGFSRQYNYYRVVNGVAQTADPEFLITNSNNTYGTTQLCFPLTPGINSLSLKVGYEWSLQNPSAAHAFIELNPWEQQHIVYFPGLHDADHDGLADALEAKIGTNPDLPDTDGDGLTDAQEVAHNTNPLMQDTDGDYFTDSEEVAAGTNPLDPNSHPSGDHVPPAVTSTDPPDTAEGALLMGPIRASFSEPLDPATVDITSFTVTGPTGAVTGAVSLSSDGLVASFVPQTAMTFATDYQVQLATAIHDLAGNPLAGNVTWQFNTGKQLTTGINHTCARLIDGGLKCWGAGGLGALGLGDTLTRGDAVGEMGAALPRVNLGTGRSVVQVVAKSSHTCVRLDDNTVKCWGVDSWGVLGLGGINPTIGDQPNEMGDNLPVVDLGSNRTVVQLAAGEVHNCARFSDGSVKCWGNNGYGALGQGDRLIARGDEPDEMGDSLPVVQLGSGRKALNISAGNMRTCAILDDHSVKCWGDNYWGNLGLGDYEHRGDDPGEMGDALPRVNLGTGRTVLRISTSGSHTCAVLDNATVKCWGGNGYGQLGLGDHYDRGGSSATMGDNLPTVELGTNRTAVSVDVGIGTSCARLDNKALKCWGHNGYGELGLGDIAYRGNLVDQMGDALPVIEVGTGRNAGEIDMHSWHACVRLDNNSVKCWGNNAAGQLGLGDTSNRGDTPGEMGDALPGVDLGN